jgi:hypothetical protein
VARGRRATETTKPPAAEDLELDQELDRLYALPLTEFTSARDELAKRLRAEQRQEQAEEVKRLRKPTVTAWLVNRLARERELEVQRLVKAGEALAQAQVEAAGGQSEGFFQARQDEQLALGRLAEAAREIAAREGIASAAVDRAGQTMRAASLTDEGRQLMKRGRLGEELQAPGFEALTALAEVTPRRPPKRPSPKPAPRDTRGERRRALEQAREHVRQLRAEEREAAAAARSAEREAERAEREASALRGRADEARAAAEQAEQRRAVAEREVERLQRG